MPRVRSKAHDVLIRHAGRRLRISKDWVDVNDEAFAALVAAEPDVIEADEVGMTEPVDETSTDEPEPAKPRRKKRGKSAEEAQE